MTCPVCGQWAPDDRETGYGADDICPRCQQEGWTIAQIDGQTVIINEPYDAALTDPRRA